MNKYYTISEFCKIIGKTPQTVRAWDKEGKLKPNYISKTGYRYYTDREVNLVLGKKTYEKEKIIVGYARVSSKKQEEDLQRQVENIKTYMYSKGYKFKIITDIGSGINYNKQGLQELIEMINNQEISKIVILYKDRLVSFGFELIEYLCEINNVEIEIIDNTTYSKEEELTQDLIQIITVFSCKLQGQRKKKTKELMESLKI